jgi:hypothetical protein
MDGGKLADELAASSGKLRALADRVASLRSNSGRAEPPTAAPLFPPGAGGAGALDDVELHFQVDDAEGGKRS